MNEVIRRTLVYAGVTTAIVTATVFLGFTAMTARSPNGLIYAILASGGFLFMGLGASFAFVLLTFGPFFSLQSYLILPSGTVRKWIFLGLALPVGVIAVTWPLQIQYLRTDQKFFALDQSYLEPDKIRKVENLFANPAHTADFFAIGRDSLSGEPSLIAPELVAYRCSALEQGVSLTTLMSFGLRPFYERHQCGEYFDELMRQGYRYSLGAKTSMPKQFASPPRSSLTLKWQPRKEVYLSSEPIVVDLLIQVNDDFDLPRSPLLPNNSKSRPYFGVSVTRPTPKSDKIFSEVFVVEATKLTKGQMYSYPFYFGKPYAAGENVFNVEYYPPQFGKYPAEVRVKTQ